ncbi:DUF2975 domain-containing protein [Maribacter sp. BPC-D8]|uniref:hypothetical protein n=1 Tax=Maribacter sp. BPC-D8 TaxID=3053613 RepID=UPI002B48F6FE|nr:hypothetical protein [Maribacter sp. BPC-D8]WRI29038.1 DUF2975 domain-containing protein [Maribacter sp. BPC-D8]
MEKLYKLLRWIIVGLIFTLGLNFLDILVKIIRYFVNGEINLKKILSINFNQFFSDIEFIIICLIIELLLGYLLYLLLKLIYFSWTLDDNKLFSKKSYKLLYLSGKVIIFISILFIGIEIFVEVKSIDQSFFSIEDTLTYSIGYIGYILGILLKILYQWIPLLILGIITLIFAELIEKGIVLKSDNDLTI